MAYINFPSFRAISIVAILQAPDGKGMQSACMEYKWMWYNGRLGYTKVKHDAKQKAVFLFF